MNTFRFCFAILLSIFLTSILLSGKLGLLVIFVLLFSLPLLIRLFSSSTETIIISMIFVVFFIPFTYFPFLNILNAINPLTALGLLLAIKAFYMKFVCREIIFSKLETVDRLYFALIISAGISTSFAISKLGAINWLHYSFISGFLVYKTISSFNVEKVIKIIKSLFLAATLCASYGIVEFILFRHSLIFPEIRVGSGRLTSLLGHPLVNGLIFASTLPLGFVLFVKHQRKSYLFAISILFLAIILTFARGSWIALLLGLLVLFIQLSLRLKVKLGLFLIAVSVFIIFPLKQEVRTRITKPEYATFSSWNIRLKSIPIAFEIVNRNPLFGGGPFNSSRYKDQYADAIELRKTSFENSYLGLLVDLGYVGFSLIMLIIFNVLCQSFRLLCTEKNNYLWLYLMASFSSFTIFLLNMATFNFDNHRLFHFFFWLFLSLNLALIKTIKKSVLNDECRD